MADFIFAAAKKAVMVIQEYKKLKGQMSKYDEEKEEIFDRLEALTDVLDDIEKELDENYARCISRLNKVLQKLQDKLEKYMKFEQDAVRRGGDYSLQLTVLETALGRHPGQYLNKLDAKLKETIDDLKLAIQAQTLRDVKSIKSSLQQSGIGNRGQYAQLRGGGLSDEQIDAALTSSDASLAPRPGAAVVEVNARAGLRSLMAEEAEHRAAKKLEAEANASRDTGFMGKVAGAVSQAASIASAAGEVKDAAEHFEASACAVAADVENVLDPSAAPEGAGSLIHDVAGVYGAATHAEDAVGKAKKGWKGLFSKGPSKPTGDAPSAESDLSAPLLGNAGSVQAPVVSHGDANEKTCIGKLQEKCLGAYSSTEAMYATMQVHAQKGYEQAAAQAQKGYARADSFVSQTLAQDPRAGASGEPAQDAFDEVAVRESDVFFDEDDDPNAPDLTLLKGSGQSNTWEWELVVDGEVHNFVTHYGRASAFPFGAFVVLLYMCIMIGNVVNQQNTLNHLNTCLECGTLTCFDSHACGDPHQKWTDYIAKAQNKMDSQNQLTIIFAAIVIFVLGPLSCVAGYCCRKKDPPLIMYQGANQLSTIQIGRLCCCFKTTQASPCCLATREGAVMKQAAKHFGDTSTWKTFRRCFCMKCEFKFAYFTVQTKAAKHTIKVKFMPDAKPWLAALTNMLPGGPSMFKWKHCIKVDDEWLFD